MDDSPIDAVMIHAVYLLNCASDDEEIRAKSLASLIHSLRVGDAIGAQLRRPAPGLGADEATSARRSSAPAEVIREALADDRPLPAAPGEHGRRGRHARALVRGAGGADRGRRRRPRGSACAWTPATCSRPATTSAPPRAWRTTLERCDAAVGLDRLGSLHLNDSQTPLGSNRDRHANLGEGELGEEGCMAFLSEPRFEGLPLVLETPGPDRSGTERGGGRVRVRACASAGWPRAGSEPRARRPLGHRRAALASHVPWRRRTIPGTRRPRCSRRPSPHVIVLFGATGDLARRKLLPGLLHLSQAGLMPREFRIVGDVARRARRRGLPRASPRSACDDFARHRFSERRSGATSRGGSTYVAAERGRHGARERVGAAVARDRRPTHGCSTT